MQRQGHYPPPPGASDIPGLEVAGVIESIGAQASATGASATRLRAGGRRRLRDDVCRAGGAVPAGARRRSTSSAPRPFPRPSSPSGRNVFDRGGLQRGRGGAVSRRLERHRHDRDSARGRRAVRASSRLPGSDEKCRACEALGAERAINYRTDDFVEVVRELTGGRGVDLILDIVGGQLRRPQPRGAGDGRTARRDRIHGRGAGGHRRSAAGARAPADDHRLDAAAAHGRGEGRDRRRRCGARCGRCSSAASSSRSSTARFRWPKPRPPTG